MKFELMAAAALLAAPALAADAPPALSPGEIVAAAPASEWVAIPPEDLLVMTLAPDAAGKSRRVIIQLIPPPFSQPWVANIRTLAKAHWWDGLAIVRAQDNYVVQWGDPDGEDAAKAKPLPDGMQVTSECDYAADFIETDLITDHCDWLQDERSEQTDRASAAADDEAAAMGAAAANAVEQAAENMVASTAMTSSENLPRSGQDDEMLANFWMRDSYSDGIAMVDGWPVALDYDTGTMWPVHCYGAVGAGRNLSPDAGTGAELYTVIGHAPRHLDRNIAVVGRVIEGIENLSTLSRGTEALGFYATPAELTPIASIRLASELPAAEQPKFEYLSTESHSFVRYAGARANRRDEFFIVPAGGADVCNIPVPVRRAQPGN